MKLLICGAMESELSTIIKNTKNKKKTPTKNIINGTLDNHNITILLTGIGKVNAAISLTEILSRNNNFDYIINLGIAGGKNIKPNTACGVSKAFFSDFDLTYFGYKKGEMPNSNNNLKTLKLKHLNLDYYTLYTQDYFVTKDLGYEDKYLTDMEGASLIYVSNKFNIPIIMVKVVSDSINSSNQKDEYINFEQKEAKDRLYEILNTIIGGLK